MIQAYHGVFTAYGFWLPNDPRGSWSDFVGSWELFRHGAATKTETRQSVAARPHDLAARRAAKLDLKYPEVHFDGHQALSIAHGFAEAVTDGGYRLLACSILPEHVHIVVARCSRSIERIIAHLKAKATAQLNADGRHPFAEFVGPRGTPPTPWAERRWKCYLDCDEAVERAIRYVEQNPVKEGKRLQRWPFVVPWSPQSAVYSRHECRG
jgi:REP element-mobilizing transposase RayT